MPITFVALTRSPDGTLSIYDILPVKPRYNASVFRGFMRDMREGRITELQCYSGHHGAMQDRKPFRVITKS